MAIGDAAAAQGLLLVDGAATQMSDVDQEINRTRDYVADVMGDIDNASAVGDGFAGELVKWGPSGTIAVPTPASSAHAVPKSYADALTAGATADGTAGGSPGKLVQWGVSGNIAAAAPTASSHVTTKAYVDAAVAASETTNASLLTSGTLSRPVSTDGAGRFGAAWDNDIGGTRRSVWMSTSGTLGWASSSRYKKQDMRPADLTVEQLRAIPVILYRYRKAVAAERAGTIPHAPTEIGTIAEDLHALGLWQFVMYEGHGEDASPVGVHYELLSLAALSLAQQLADRLDEIAARLTAAGL